MKNLNSVICFIFLFILSLSPVHAEQCEIRILHINDFHGFAEPYNPFGSDEMLGGIAYLTARMNALLNEKPSLLLSAGDMIQGNNWANLSQGESVIELMNTMKFDAMVVGNHEFDFGQDVLKKRISEAKFPVLGANVEGLDMLEPFMIKDINGIKVAVIGIVTEDTPVSTHPRNVSGLKFFSSESTAKKYVTELKNKADIIIILSHIGHHADRILAERVRGIDVIVGGHSHTKVEKPVRVGNTIIVQAWEHAKALGVLDLTVKDGKITKFNGYLEEIKPETGKEDNVVLAIVEKYKQKVDAVLNEKVGDADVDLDGENVRRKETNLGNLITDVMRYASGADIAIINGGTIRTSIKKGEVKVKNVYSVLPFDNYIVAIKLTGKQIKKALEHGVSAIEEGAGRFPQVSGLSFKYKRSAKTGEKVNEILIANKPIDPDKEYIVATNDFLAAGGDGYEAFGEAIKASGDFSIIGGVMKGEKVVYSDSGRWLRDVVIEYIKEKKRIDPTVEGRITEIQ
ncbi:MAG: 5'-nucleotidase C-terminal domain-containing protein [Nitrospirota bacterium]|nr:5'-nucleotidase C-terminal domain-containing protein [Nitrospirota bacterium]MDH5767983.1 5'-nucleotidase C-terminal domain-containing protein [Nitrospirota bacterium]